MTAAPPGLPGIESLYEHAACGLLVTGRDGLIRRVNQTFCNWLGYTADTLVGQRKLQELLTMGGRIFHQTHWVPLLQMQGSVAEVKLDLLHREGHTIPMMLNAVRRGSGEAVTHEVSAFVAEDRHKYERELLSARRRAEELQAEIGLQHAAAQDRALFAEQMVGIVSHDLRNPLSAIQMSAHLLERGDLTANQRSVLGRIQNSGGRAQRLIADLLDFTLARVGQGLTLNRSEISLHQLVSDSVDELAVAFPGRRIEHRSQGEGECFADADRLIQLIGNLVGNAVAYGAPDSTVTVASSIDADGIGISVHNQGPPIPAALQSTLFEPMIRGAGGKGSRGVGLGLFIVREIARSHEGSVSVHSNAHDGTTFIVRLPQRRL